MILQQLILNDFGPYLGHQVLDLLPTEDDTPIILIGGLNGGGKTSLLDAIQLVLYGKRARCSKRPRQGSRRRHV